MVFGHKHLEVCCGDVVRTTLMFSPFHKEAVGNAPEHAQDEDPFVTLNAATIVVVRDIQPLMQAALDAPTLAVKFQPPLSPQPFGWSAGD